MPSDDSIIVAGDPNGHVGATKDDHTCHGGFGYGSRIDDGERILDYADSHDLIIANTMFRKRYSHLISFNSGSATTQIDFVLVLRRDQDLVTEAKVIPSETLAPQHRPLVYAVKITAPKKSLTRGTELQE